MGLLSLFVSASLILMLCSFPCYGSYLYKHPIHHHHHSLLEKTSDDPNLAPSIDQTSDDPNLAPSIDQTSNDPNLAPSIDQTLSSSSSSPSSQSTVSVEDFGAKGDGESDDTKAFEKAWKKACSSFSSSGSVIFSVPSNKIYLLKPITFSGPCKARLTVQISGTVLASDDRSDYEESDRRWLMFDGIDNMSFQGSGGKINGNGKIWWQNSCKVNKNLPCKKAPTALTFYDCKNLVVSDVTIVDAQQMHVVFQKCSNVKVSRATVTAPEDSPNTDGIHITGTEKISIRDTVIGTGDDCISIVDGSKNVRAAGITCGPGHGISIGSLGEDNSEARVTDVLVNGATLTGTTNGVRIKTWQGGSGAATDIRFVNIVFKNVKNPIIIDQNYCDQDKPCKTQSSAVQVKNVLYENIKGTSASKEAIVFDCSKSVPCQGIKLNNVRIERRDGEAAEATCTNVKLSATGVVSPTCN